MILLIDDEEVVRRVGKAMLEHYGHSVVLAQDGKEGVDIFRILDRRVAAVLLDMTMPAMSGEEAYRVLKTIRPDVRVVLSSGYNEVESVSRFAGKGLSAFIQKPYSAAELAKKMESVLG